MNEKDKIETLNLSVRAQNCLLNNNINTIADLIKLDYDDIYRFKNCGVKTCKEITSKIDFIMSFNSDDKVDSSLGNVINTVPFRKTFDIVLVSLNTDIKYLPLSNRLKEYLVSMNYKNLGDVLSIFIYDDSNEIFFELSEYQKYIKSSLNDNIISYISPTIDTSYFLCPFDLECTEEVEIGQYISIEDLIYQYESKKYIMTDNDILNIKLLFEYFEKFKGEDICNLYFSRFDLTDKQIEFFGKRLYMSLESIGSENQITRERVRQIEKKAYDKISKDYDKIIFKKFMTNDLYLIDQLNYYDLFFLRLDVEYEHNYFIVRDGNVNYAITTKYVNEINKALDEKYDELKENGYIDFIFSDFVSPLVLKLTLKKVGIKYFNNHLFFNLNKRQMIYYSLRKIGRPIKKSSPEDKNLIISTAKMLFDFDISTDRSLSALIDDVAVRVDSGTYSYKDDTTPLDSNTLKSIEKYIDENKIINTRDLFLNFSDELYSHNLNNSTILYRYLKEIIGDKYYFSGVSEVIGISEDYGSWGVYIESYIKEKGRPVSKSELISKFSLSDPVYNMLSVNFDNIILWGREALYLKSLVILDNQSKEKIYNELKQKSLIDLSDYYDLFRIEYKDLSTTNYIKNERILENFLINFICDSNLVFDRRKKIILYKMDKKEKEVKKFNAIETEETF